MADLGKNLKSIWMKGMEAIGNTASNIASNTKYKVDEMNLLNRRREILSDFGAKAYAMWQKGEFLDFPESLKRDLEELTRLDNQLVDMRAEHFGGEEAVDSEKKNEGEAADPEKESPKDDESASAGIPEGEQDETVPVIEAETNQRESEAEADDSTEPISSDSLSEIPESLEEINHQASSITEAINDLFDQIPSVDSMADKMNDTLDQMGNNLKKFSEDLDAHIQDLNDKLNGSGDEPPKAP